MHGLHHGNANDEETYIFKMSISTIHGGLWGDFILIYCIFKYLHHSIHVWNDQIMVKVKQGNASTPLNLVYGNNILNLLKVIQKLQMFLLLFIMMAKKKNY